MTREEIISAWKFVEDGLPFDAIESKDNRVDMHELIYYTIKALSAIDDIKTEIGEYRDNFILAGRHDLAAVAETCLMFIDKHSGEKENE